MKKVAILTFMKPMSFTDTKRLIIIIPYKELRIISKENTLVHLSCLLTLKVWFRLESLFLLVEQYTGRIGTSVTDFDK